MKRYHLDTLLDSMDEDPEGEWVRWEDVETLLAKFSGPRCELCANLCVDVAKDENGYCPDCSAIAGQIEFAGYLDRLKGEKP